MSQDIETMLQSTCECLQQGNIVNGTTLLHELLSEHPGCAPGLQMLGMVHAMQGDMRAAARLLRQACVVAPDSGSLRLHLARIEWELGMPAQAAASYEHAIASGCTSPDIRTDCAVALQALKNYPAALQQCDAALEQDPHHARAWHTRANLLHQQNRMDEALCCHERAIALAPHAKAWSAKAATLDAIGKLDEALACHEQALERDPENAAAWTHRGATLGKMGRHEQALACHAHATELDPSLAFAWSNMGATLSRLSRSDEALAAHDRAISLQPSSAALWVQRGAALMGMQRHGEALASFNAAIRLDPASAHAWYHRGLALRIERRPHEALESLEEALLLDAAHAAAAILRSEVLQLLDRDAEALKLLEQSIATTPEDPRLRLALGVNQLAVGNFTDGWSNVQSCRQLDESEAPRHAHLPRWSGAEAVHGKRVLVYAEHGHGDVIQFCRYVPRLASHGCEVVFEVYPNLRRLLSTLGGCLVAARGEPLPLCDYCIPLMALPQALGAQMHDIPRQVSYLHTRKRASGSGRNPDGGLRVGIACSGNPALHTNTTRSAPLACFETLQQHCTLVLLQNAVASDDAARLASNPGIQHPTAGSTDFYETACVIGTLDLVISVDTSIAHLAGALGKPVWILLPRLADWRWFKDRDDSPWYPGARLFRQRREGDWASVFALVEVEIQRLAVSAGRLRQGAA